LGCFSLPVFYFDVVQLIQQRIPVPLIVPQETVNNMFLTRSTVATLAFLVGLVQLGAALKVCISCETIPADCYGGGKDCAALSGTTQLVALPNSFVSTKVCVVQGDISSPFNIFCTHNPPSGSFDASSVSCPSKTYLYTENSAGDKLVFRSGSGTSPPGFPLSSVGNCGAQRGFCLSTLSPSSGAVIDTTVSPWEIRVDTGASTRICKLATGFASNHFQLYCS
jgi:hypothetical protein